MKKYISRLAAAAAISLSTACSNNTLANSVQADYVTNSIKDFQKKVIGDILTRTLDENEPLMDQELLNDIAINGLKPFFTALKEKDGYMSYVTTYNSTKETEPIDHLGTYGLSLTFNSFSNNYQVQQVEKGSIAEKAGFQTGDTIRKLNGVDVTKLSTKKFKETVQQIHSEHPERIVVDAYRMGTGEIALHILLKNTLATPPVAPKIVEAADQFSDNVLFRYFPAEDVAYMRIFSFSNDNAIGESARAGLRHLLKNNSPKALVLDLRNNSGGYVQEANEIISMFAKNKKTFRLDDRVTPFASQQEVTQSEFYIPELEHLPLYILVNRNTASSSEITTLCLKELHTDNIVVMGEKTYGKGIYQSPFSVNLPVGPKDSYKVEMMISTGEWYSPNGTFVGNPNTPKPEDGIKPDVLFKNEEAMPLAELTKLEDVFLGAAMFYIGNKISNVTQIPLRYSSIEFHGSFDRPQITSSLPNTPSYK